MTPSQYMENAKKTESKKYKFESTGKITPRIEHGAMGAVTEAGELMDIVKKCKIYGKEFDKLHMIEEMGDLMWYLAILCDDLEVSFEEVWEKNIKKLKTRYPERYTDDNAINRDYENERKEMESSE
jgi:NTP pyrophosphatase (non-canonical NTP hydrolase)